MSSNTLIDDTSGLSAGDDSASLQGSAPNGWLMNAPLLYDYLALHELEFPSYNVQWMKGITPEKARYSSQRVLLSTHAPRGESNFIYRLSFQIPLPETEVDLSHFGEHGNEKAKSTFMGGIVVPSGRLIHEGPVYALEYCPTNPECVVSTGEEGGVYLFDFQKQPLSPIDSIMHPDASYTGQLATCKTLSWSCHNEQISAGGEDGAICVWDASVPSKYIVRYSHHQQSVLSLAWNQHQGGQIFSGGEDGFVYLYDIRQQEIALSQNMGSAVSALSIHPVERTLLATADKDGVVNLWDYRNLDCPLHAFIGHSEAVTSIEWNPFDYCVFATCGGDGRVCLWNLDWIGRHLDSEEQMEGPSELLFVHGGHEGRVNDIRWNPTTPWVLASVGEDQSLQLWELAEPIYTHIPQQGDSSTVLL